MDNEHNYGMNKKRKQKLTKPEKWIVIGIPCLFLLCSGMHFLYELSGHHLLVGLFAPINESIWEHMKMVLLPMFLWWTVYYVIVHNKIYVLKRCWFGGAFIAVTISLVIIPIGYYSYTHAFGVESVLIDVLILFIAIVIGQVAGLFFYHSGKTMNERLAISILCIYILLFIFFTLYPFPIPLFTDSLTGKRGIL